MNIKSRLNTIIPRNTGYAFAACLLVFIVYKILYKFYLKLFYIGPSSSTVAGRELLGYPLLPESFNPYLGDSVVLSSFYSPVILAYFAVCLALIYFLRKDLSWASFHIEDFKFRLAVALIAGALTWTYSFYDYNYFLDNYFLLDRLLLLGLNVLIFYSPVAILFYLPVLFLMMSSFNYFIGGYSLTDKLLLINIFIITCSWLCINIATRLFKSLGNFRIVNFTEGRNILLTSLLVIIAVSYFHPFLSKVSISSNYIDWWLIEDFGIATGRYFDRGWLSFLSADLKESILFYVDRLSAPLLLFAFITEFASVFILIKYRLTIFLLLVFTLIHLAIFALSGVFFWKWMCANILIAAYFHFSGNYLKTYWRVAGTLFIVPALFIVSFPSLGWYSIPYQTHYSISAVSEGGKEYNIAGSDMAPYDIYFTFSRWHILNEPTIRGDNWSRDPEQYAKLLTLNVSELKNYESANGSPDYNEESYNNLIHFLKTYFKNYNKYPNRKNALGIFSPLKHVYMSPESDEFQFNVPVSQVNIYYKNCYYNTSIIKECNKDILYTVNID